MLLTQQTWRGQIRRLAKASMAVGNKDNSGRHLWSSYFFARHTTTIISTFLFVFCNPVRQILSIFYRREKWGSSRLSNLIKFIDEVRDRIRLWHIIPKTVPSVLPGRANGASPRKRTDDYAHDIVSRHCWWGLVLQIPPKSKDYLQDYLQESSLTKSKGQISIDFAYHNLLQDEAGSFPL